MKIKGVLTFAFVFLFIIVLFSGVVSAGWFSDIFNKITGKAIGDSNKVSRCNDHIDNDGDGYCDYSGKKSYCNDGSQVGDVDCKNRNSEESVSCVPTKEICDGIDNDCNGLIDENVYDTRTCGSDVGECKKGIQTRQCYFGEFGPYGSCEGWKIPLKERCDGKDNDCNGQVDEYCEG